MTILLSEVPVMMNISKNPAEWIGKIISDLSFHLYCDESYNRLVAIFLIIEGTSYKISCHGDSSYLNISCENYPDRIVDMGDLGLMKLVHCQEFSEEIKNRYIEDISSVMDKFGHVGLFMALSENSHLCMINWGDDLIVSKAIPSSETGNEIYFNRDS